MSNNHASSERTPLLGNDGAVDDDDRQPKTSRWHRLESWTSDHQGSLIFGLLAVLFFALFLVTFITRSPIDRHSPSPAPGGDVAKICTATGCVLASATLLRSISPR